MPSHFLERLQQGFHGPHISDFPQCFYRFYPQTQITLENSQQGFHGPHISDFPQCFCRFYLQTQIITLENSHQWPDRRRPQWSGFFILVEGNCSRCTLSIIYWLPFQRVKGPRRCLPHMTILVVEGGQQWLHGACVPNLSQRLRRGLRYIRFVVLESGNEEL